MSGFPFFRWFLARLTGPAAWLRPVLQVGLLAGLSSGVASAAFLSLLAHATAVRQAHLNVVWALPIAGFGLGCAYARFGGRSMGGGNLVIDALFHLGPQLPRRMAPLVLLGTVATHLFGGSAGREGTAVQMGASLADACAHRLGHTGPRRRDWLRAGVAGGFGSVFGTPLAATFFAAEFFGGPLPSPAGMASAGVAALVADATARFLGATHAVFPTVAPVQVCALLAAKWLVLSAACVMAVLCFVGAVGFVKRHLSRWIPSLSLRMAAGGMLVVASWQAGLPEAALGLGTKTLSRAFTDPYLPWPLPLAKLVMTAFTIGSGFLGGEVTPVFFVGASLGNLASSVLFLPLPMAAAVGMSAVFAGAAHAPLAMTAMASELFGLSAVPHVFFCCCVTSLLLGPRKLYGSQRHHPLAMKSGA